MTNTQTNNKQTNTAARVSFVALASPDCALDDHTETTIFFRGEPVGWIMTFRSNFRTWQNPNCLVSEYEVVLHGSEELGLNIKLHRTFDVARAGRHGAIVDGDPSASSVLASAKAWARAAVLVCEADRELAAQSLAAGRPRAEWVHVCDFCGENYDQTARVGLHELGACTPAELPTPPPVECPRGLKSWTADEVSECISYGPHLPYSYGDSDQLSRKLWGFLASATNPTPSGGDGSNGTVDTPAGRHDEDNDDKAPSFWGRLTRDEQIAIARGYLLESFRDTHVLGWHAFQDDAHIVSWGEQPGSALWVALHIQRFGESLAAILGEESPAGSWEGLPSFRPTLVVEGFKIHGSRHAGICSAWIDVAIRNDDGTTEDLCIDWNGRAFQWTDAGEAIELGADPAQAAEALRFLPVLPKVGR